MAIKTDPFQFYSEAYIQHFYVEIQSETSDNMMIYPINKRN